MKLTTPNICWRRSLGFTSVLICSALPAKVAAAESTTDFPIWIELDKPQLVMIVIEDAAGRRVRNLVADRSRPVDFPDFTKGKWKTNPPIKVMGV